MLNVAQAGSFIELIESFGGIINLLIGIVAGIALLVFFFGLAKFIFRTGDSEKAIEEGKRLMIWGVIALFVMVSIWGIVGFIQDALGLPNTTRPPVPIPDDIPLMDPFDPRMHI